MELKQQVIKNYIFLHIAFLFYSVNGILSKLAAKNIFLSTKFFCFYIIILINLFIYAVCWQQILKRISLASAFSNKSIIIVWGMLWGALLFHERITIKMMIGVVIIFIGVYLVVTSYE